MAEPDPRRTSRRRRQRLALLLAALTGCALAVPAQAQLDLPRVTLPSLPRAPSLPPNAVLSDTLALPPLRSATVRDLLRDHPDVLESDPAGQPVRRQELVLVSPAPSTLDAARAEGFVVLREQALPELELRQLVLRAPLGVTTAQALARLRAIEPALEVDFNHVYTRSGDAVAVPIAAVPLPAAAHARRVGLIDSGVDGDHAALRGTQLRRWGCGDAPVASPHGTAVASLLVGRDRGFTGAVPGAQLFAADIYCGQPAGGSVEQLALALAWLVREQVAVINVSLVGPPNRVLERAVTALHQRGHLIVAAVGNDGPAAAPLYPAAYAGVVAVTGVTPARRALPEAGQGPHVAFAAPGSELAVAHPGGGYGVARGTSFAAPLVAGLLAQRLHAPDREAALAALAEVAIAAQDLGAPGRDPVFGLGLVAERVRVAPERLRAAAR